MGTEVLVAAALTAAATGAQMYNQRRTAKKQDNALASRLRGQAQRQREADAKVQQIIADQAASTPDDERLTASRNYQQALRQARGQAEGGLVPMSGASDAFKESGRQAAAGIGDYGERLAGLLSTIDAPAMQRRNEGLALNRRAGELDILSRFDQGNTWLDDLRLRAIRRNPWVDAFSQVAAGASRGMSMGSGTAPGGG